MKDSQDWLDTEINRLVHRTCDHKSCSDIGVCIHAVNDAKSAIRKHILQEALGLVGEDEAMPGFTNNVDRRIMHRNNLRQELRNKFNDKYKED